MGTQRIWLVKLADIPVVHQATGLSFRKGIKRLFAKLKALLRKASARTKEALWTTIGELLDEFSPEECRNYLRNSGYEPV